MNKILALVFSAALFVGLADTNSTETVTLDQLVLESGWTAQELIDALDLLEAKYWRDVSTESGRRSWHGRKVGEAVDTNTLAKITTYEDGMRFSDPARVVTPLDTVKRINATLTTNNIPQRLAAARLRASRGTVTNNVTVTLTAGH